MQQCFVSQGQSFGKIDSDASCIFLITNAINVVAQPRLIQNPTTLNHISTLLRHRCNLKMTSLSPQPQIRRATSRKPPCSLELPDSKQTKPTKPQLDMPDQQPNLIDATDPTLRLAAKQGLETRTPVCASADLAPLSNL